MLKTAAKFHKYLSSPFTLPRGVGLLLVMWAFNVGVLSQQAPAALNPALGPISSTETRDLMDRPRFSMDSASQIQAPPYEMRGDVRVMAEFIWPDKVGERCRDERAAACMEDAPGRPTLVMPNPCWFTSESYAAMTCHEIAHVNGWRHDKPNECEPPAGGESSWFCERLRQLHAAGYEEIGTIRWKNGKSEFEEAKKP